MHIAPQSKGAIAVNHQATFAALTCTNVQLVPQYKLDQLDASPVTKSCTNTLKAPVLHATCTASQCFECTASWHAAKEGTGFENDVYNADQTAPCIQVKATCRCSTPVCASRWISCVQHSLCMRPNAQLHRKIAVAQLDEGFTKQVELHCYCGTLVVHRAASDHCIKLQWLLLLLRQANGP